MIQGLALMSSSLLFSSVTSAEFDYLQVITLFTTFA